MGLEGSTVTGCYYDEIEEWNVEMEKSSATKTEKSDLKPCPFCGNEPISYYIPPHEHYIVDFPPFEGAGYVECPHCDCGLSAKTEEEAIEKWNRRNGDERDGDG